MEINERLQEIMKHYSISAAQLADQLEVQRSGISHILSGRNKPGLDFIKKLLLNFEDINALWLITGKGSMIENKTSKSVLQNESPTPPNKNSSLKNAGDPDKIIIFYKDKSFELYKQKKADS